MSSAVVENVSPLSTPLACWCHPRLRSPPSNVRNVSPCESGPRPASEPAVGVSVSPSQRDRLPPSQSAPPSTTRHLSMRNRNKPALGHGGSVSYTVRKGPDVPIVSADRPRRTQP